MATDARDVLVTGGTGYIGQRLVSHLAARGHRVRVLARRTALARVPAMATAVEGDALDAASVASALRPGDTIVHLVGTPHPNPSKAAEFERVDLASIRATTEAARQVAPAHIVYVSVAHPAPMMHAYIAVRTAGEEAVSAVGCSATIVRPWYVLGPGHWWPVGTNPRLRNRANDSEDTRWRHAIGPRDRDRHGLDIGRRGRASAHIRRADPQRARHQGDGKKGKTLKCGMRRAECGARIAEFQSPESKAQRPKPEGVSDDASRDRQVLGRDHRATARR